MGKRKGRVKRRRRELSEKVALQLTGGRDAWLHAPERWVNSAAPVRVMRMEGSTVCFRRYYHGFGEALGTEEWQDKRRNITWKEDP